MNNITVGLNLVFPIRNCFLSVCRSFLVLLYLILKYANYKHLDFKMPFSEIQNNKIYLYFEMLEN